MSNCGMPKSSPDFKVWTVRDTASEGALLKAIGDHVERLARAGPDAVGFFYYSGHGAADRPNGENFLIPTEVPLTHASQLPLMAVRLEKITATLASAGKMSFVVFDACRNVLLLRDDKDFGFKGFAPVREQNGLLVAFATEPGNVAADQSVYANVLSDELIKPGLEAGQVFRSVTRRVLIETQQKQSPEYLDKRLNDFYFAAVVPVPRPVVVLKPTFAPDIQFTTYRDPKGNFSFDAPKPWTQKKDSDRADGPVVSVFLLGQETVDGKQVAVDVAVSVTKLPRRAELFATERDYDAFRRSTLLQVDALFGPPAPELKEPLRSLIAKDTQDIIIAGIGGKAYRRDYDYVDPKYPNVKPLAVTVEDVVLKTPDAYYILEYRVRRDLFDRYRFVGERLRATFQPGRP
jgi:hypothetical protein